MKQKQPENLTLDKIREDLGGEFPFSALWQDEQPSGGALLPIISVIANVATLIVAIILLIKK